MKLSARSFTDRAVNVMVVARKLAKKRHHAEILPEHVLLGLAIVKPGAGCLTLTGLGFDLSKNRYAVARLLSQVPPAGEGKSVALSAETTRLLDVAKAQAIELGHNYIGDEHLVLAMLVGGEGSASDLLRSRGITAETFRQELSCLVSGA
jgi:ATP-dependent Clp protease ATP-binding subunit ClpC